jgi:hypothetical protein
LSLNASNRAKVDHLVLVRPSRIVSHLARTAQQVGLRASVTKNHHIIRMMMVSMKITMIRKAGAVRSGRQMMVTTSLPCEEVVQEAMPLALASSIWVH